MSTLTPAPAGHSPDRAVGDLGEPGWRGALSRAVAQMLSVTGVVLILSIGGLFDGADRIMLDLFIRADDLQAHRSGRAGSDHVVIASLPEAT